MTAGTTLVLDLVVEAMASILGANREVGFLVSWKRVELESVSVMLAMGERVREDRCQWGHDHSLALNNRAVRR